MYVPHLNHLRPRFGMRRRLVEAWRRLCRVHAPRPSTAELESRLELVESKVRHLWDCAGDAADRIEGLELECGLDVADSDEAREHHAPSTTPRRFTPCTDETFEPP